MARQAGKSKSLHPSHKKPPAKAKDPSVYEDMPFKWRAYSQYIDYDVEEWGWEGMASDPLPIN